MKRVDARCEAFKIVYEIDVNGSSKEEILSRHLEKIDKDDPEAVYIKEVAVGVFDNLDKIDELIQKASKSRTLKRLNRVDLAIFRVAVYEMLKRDDIPNSISIFEAVELVKLYDSVESGGFANGLLRSINRFIEEE